MASSDTGSTADASFDSGSDRPGSTADADHDNVSADTGATADHDPDGTPDATLRDGTAPTPKSIPEVPMRKKVSENPANYGTSPANIANGGFVAYSDGVTYILGDSGGPGNGSPFARTAIWRLDGDGASPHLIYQCDPSTDAGHAAGSANGTPAVQGGTPSDEGGSPSGASTVSGNRRLSPAHGISCLHVTDDSLVFCETSAKASSYAIVRTDLDGTNRERIVEHASLEGCPGAYRHLDTHMWLDDGKLYYLADGSLWELPLSGGTRRHIAEVGVSAVCSVDDGVVYYSSDLGRNVTALSVEDGTSATVYQDTWIKDENALENSSGSGVTSGTGGSDASGAMGGSSSSGGSSSLSGSGESGDPGKSGGSGDSDGMGGPNATSADDQGPAVRNIMPDGDELYFIVEDARHAARQDPGYSAGVAEGLPMQGIVVVGRDGSNTRYHELQIDNPSLGVSAACPVDGMVYLVFGRSRLLNMKPTGIVGIYGYDPHSGGDSQPDNPAQPGVGSRPDGVDRLQALYATDIAGNSYEGDIDPWINVVNGRAYFESTVAGNHGINAVQEPYDRGTPWSVRLDGSDLRRGIW